MTDNRFCKLPVLIKMYVKSGIVFLISGIVLVSLLVSCTDDNIPVINNSEYTGDNADDDTDADNSENYAETVADALAANKSDHEETGDYVWDDSQVVQINLNGNSIVVNGSGVTVDGSIATITSAGTYRINGTLNDGQILVNTEDEQVVRLILSGITISNSVSSPLFIQNAEKTIIVLADNTENYISDGDTYVFENAEEDEPNAAIFSKDDLTIYGNGSLTVNGNYNDGIAGKDGLIIAGGNIAIVSKDDGIRGKDYLIIKDGTIGVNAGGDGLKSNNDEDSTRGYVLVETGNITITSGVDAIQASTDVLISGGEFILSTGGGSGVSLSGTETAKGIKATVNTIIDKGTITVNSADDAVHSNGSMAINGGTFNISSGDDGFHSDDVLDINGGDIKISKSYEGIESKVITINSGQISLVASDDGLNVAGGNDGSGMPGWPGTTNFSATDGYYLYINGGRIAVYATGDGIDINGSVEMTGGDLIIHGPTQDMNGAVDYDGTFKISGGNLIAVGSSGMAQAPGTTSSQNSLLLNFSAQQAGTLVHIQDADGNSLLTFKPDKEFESIAFSSSGLITGNSYDVYFGGNSTGTSVDGLYSDGTYTPGDLYTSFAVSGVVTKLGNTGNNPPGGR